MVRPEAHDIAVGVTAPVGFLLAAARRPVAPCRLGEGAEVDVGCSLHSGVGVVPAGIAASCTAEP